MDPHPSPGQHCPVCGVPLPARTPAGQCPKCLIKLGLSRPPEPDRAVPAPPGSERIFGDYRLRRQIGRGGMGVVYEAEDVRLHRPVALKVILDSELASSVTRRRFRIEAEAAAKLDHPHIVPIYEVGECEGQPFLSMKLVPGESLRRRMARGEFRGHPEPGGQPAARDRQTTVAHLMAALARAVHHAHLRGVLHRDLKPGNILIDGEGQPFVTDFGLAKIAEGTLGEAHASALTVSGMVVGTPDYMSPEQARGGRLGAATDIYSLGAILYELLTGRPPFHAPTPVETLRAVVEQVPRLPRTVDRTIDRDLETICLKCLEKHPAARYGTAAALAEDLDRWLRKEPIAARPAGPWLRTVRWVNRNPLGTALILSLCLGLGVATGLLVHARRQGAQDDMKRRLLLQGLWRDIQTELDSTNTTPIRISSELLCVLGDYPLPQDLGVPLRVSLTVSPTDSPLELAESYVRFLKLLEKEAAKRLDRPVRIDLVVCREHTPNFQCVSRGDTDFQRMGLMPYLLAKGESPGVEAVVQEAEGKRAIIFVRQECYDRGATNLARLAGHAFAFGDTNSTISLLAKTVLADAGVRGTNLHHYVHISAYGAQAETAIGEAKRLTGQRHVRRDMERNDEIVRAVTKGGFDAGVVRLRFFARNKYRGLVALEAFEAPPDVYVARAGLDPDVISAFRRSLLSLRRRDTELDGAGGFVPLDEALCRRLGVALTNAAASFP